MNFTKKEYHEPLEDHDVFITHYRAEGYKIIFSNSKAGTVEFDYETMTKAEAYDLIHVTVDPYYKLCLPGGEIIGYPFYTLEEAIEFCRKHYVNRVLDKVELLALNAKIVESERLVDTLLDMISFEKSDSKQQELREKMEIAIDELYLAMELRTNQPELEHNG